MKNLKQKTATLLFLLASFITFAQVGIGTESPQASSALDITSSDKGFLMPRMTSAEKLNISPSASAEGLQVYDTDTKSIWVFDGSQWNQSQSSSKFIDGTNPLDAVFTGGNVGIGTTDPEGLLDIVSTSSGLILNRVANTAAVTAPINGMIVYDVSTNCTKFYENDAWTDCVSIGGSATAAVLAADCDQNGFEGSYVSGVAFGASNDFTVTFTNNSFSTSNISLTTSDLVLSGTALGSVTVASVAPTSVTLTAGQTQVVTYQLSGSPVVGELQADWSKISLSCTKTKTVGTGDASFTLPATAAIVSIYDGSPLVDIQGVADNAANQFIVNVPYTSGIGTYDAYASGVVTSAAGTGEGGDANGFSISYPAGTFGTSGSIAVTITVDGDGSFDAEKQLFGVLKTIASMDLQLNGSSKGNVDLKVVGGVPDRNFADANHQFVYIPVTSAGGETWLNNNLGADYANLNHASFSPISQASASTDYHAYGSQIQFGRYTDGHELINWTSSTATDGAEQANETSTASPMTTVGHADFIFRTSPSYNWYSGIDTLWEGEAGINNPCPQGYRLPTQAEWNVERLSWATNNTSGALASPLKLTVSGRRGYFDGAFQNIGTNAYYWSSTLVSSDSSIALWIYATNALTSTFTKAYGMPVRCIKD